MTANTTTEGLKYLCRHLVGLCVTYRHTTPEEAHLRSRFATCSGTLLFVEGALYFLTAGHVLKSLSELRDSNSAMIEGASLADVFGYRRISDTPIPFDFKNAQLCFVDNDKLGLDFGIIPLGPHHARHLSKNGVAALSQDDWTRQRGTDFDGYAMLGFPSERVSERISDDSTVRIEATLIPVRVSEFAASQSDTVYPRFVGQVADDLTLKSLEGMSGGLILGFRTKPRLTYWIVAIQSSWHPQTKTVYGCRLPILGSLISHWTRENLPVLHEIDANTAEICLTVPNAAPPPGILWPQDQ